MVDGKGAEGGSEVHAQEETNLVRGRRKGQVEEEDDRLLIIEVDVKCCNCMYYCY